MFAPNKPFLTSEELRLTEVGHRGLIETLRGLEDGTIRHVPINKRQNHDNGLSGYPITRPVGINMCRIKFETDCGSVCCVGGWMMYFAGTREIAVNYSINLARLFMPPHWYIGNYDEVQVARAVRSFLETGEADWS